MRSSTWRALGNTYRVVVPDGEELDAYRARDLAAGTDGVVEVLARMPNRLDVRIWNPDGSQAELSGNGTRIAAAWHAARSGAREFDVVVGERVVATRVRENGSIEQDLGEVAVGEQETIDGVSFVPVNVGNPHAVVLGDPVEVTRLGPLLETHPRFPNRTNVQVARVDGPGEVTARVWERGVGETLSSGTSAVAVAAATHRDGDVVVHFPGGDLRVTLAHGHARLVGTAEELRVPRQVLVHVYRRHRDRIEFLLLERTPAWGGFWQGVTGAPTWVESDEEAALRELHEETGLDGSGRLHATGFRFELRLSEVEDVEAWVRTYGPGVDAVPGEVYAVEPPSGWEPVLAPREHEAFRWCSLDEGLALLRFEENREALRAVARWLASGGHTPV